MQGRLSPDPENKIQFFPVDTWKSEFAIASDCGFNSIELTIDLDSYKNHPLLTKKGRNNIHKLKKENNIDISVICCDIFMDLPFFNINKDDRSTHVKILKKIIKASSEAGLSMIEIPVIGPSSIKNQDDMNLLIEAIWDCMDLADNCGIKILLETDLSPYDFKSLIDIFGGKVGLSYDTGNSTYFEFDQYEEIIILGDLIENIHIKDCMKGEPYKTVSLGTGETPFEDCFKAFNQIGYNGNFIIQAAREPDNLGAAKQFLSFTQGYIDKHLKFIE